MLIHLLITDFAVVKTLELDFSAGMTVITGETGAGKSILLNALSLVMGERAETHWVRPECEKAEIAATFDITKLAGAILWLTDAELLNQHTTQECIIRRIVYKNGRSKALINGKPVTTAQLRLLGEYLLQIHGQHQHQLLLKPFEQLRLLDAFGQHQALLSAVRKAYEVYENLEQEIQHLKSLTADLHRVALLEYQVEELSHLEISPNEWEELCSEQRRLSHAQSHLSSISAAFDQLKNDDASVLTLLQKAQNHLQDLIVHYPKLQTVLDLLKTAEVHVEESWIELDQLLNSIQLNPERLQEIDTRLSRMYAIARKHKVEPSQLRNFQHRLSEELTKLKDSEDRIIKLTDHLELAKKSYQKVTSKLTSAREKASKQLAQEIACWFVPLGLKGASFHIELEHHPEHFSPLGLESAQYKVSTNVGHPLLPMQKIVSGGELSRISLAIQLITAKYQETPTLVFDEVDVGVGGGVGSKIGKALSKLAENVQVFCITHLPQVAAEGTQHFQVSKHHKDGTTQTNIKLLTKKDRVKEIARMLDGIQVTPEAQAHAKNLLKRKLEKQPLGS